MLDVRFRRDSRQRLSSIFASGHAEAAEAGSDVVCAAASAILQAAELGLLQYAALETVVQRGDGCMLFTIPGGERDREDVKAIVGTAELAIAQLAQQYPINVSIGREREIDASSGAVEFLGKYSSNGELNDRYQ